MTERSTKSRSTDEVHCELWSRQAALTVVGQLAEVWVDGDTNAVATGKVAVIGKVADRNSGMVPVVVRVPNPQGRLRVEVLVKLRFVIDKGK
jgi:multidrug efflux pump subunit AcrA (membrane-fusion protein)